MEELRNKIINAINESKLPVDCIYYLIKDVYREVADLYQLSMQKQEKEVQQEEPITKVE